jgi:hypothetical protein
VEDQMGIGDGLGDGLGDGFGDGLGDGSWSGDGTGDGSAYARPHGGYYQPFSNIAGVKFLVQKDNSILYTMGTNGAVAYTGMVEKGQDAFIYKGADGDFYVETNTAGYVRFVDDTSAIGGGYSGASFTYEGDKPSTVLDALASTASGSGHTQAYDDMVTAAAIDASVGR